MTAILLFSLCASLGILVGTMVGFAGALVAVPFMLLFLPPKVALPAYTLIMLVTNLVAVVEGRRHLHLKRLTLLTVAGVAGTLAGSWSLAHLPTGAVQVIVSLVTLAFGLLFLLKVPIRLKERPAIDVTAGLLSGWLGGCVSQSGPPVVFLALARGWDKEVFRVTLLSYFSVLNLVAVLAYWRLDLFSTANLTLGAAALAPTLLMSVAGLWLKNRIDERHFRTAVLVLLLVVGVVGLIPRG